MGLWWERVDSNHRSRRQQIYSLPPLATREHSHMQLKNGGAGGRIRTPDLLITNQLLYQLSYTSKQLIYYSIPPRFCQALFSEKTSRRAGSCAPGSPYPLGRKAVHAVLLHPVVGMRLPVHLVDGRDGIVHPVQGLHMGLLLRGQPEGFL